MDSIVFMWVVSCFFYMMCNIIKSAAGLSYKQNKKMGLVLKFSIVKKIIKKYLKWLQNKIYWKNVNWKNEIEKILKFSAKIWN